MPEGKFGVFVLYNESYECAMTQRVLFYWLWGILSCFRDIKFNSLPFPRTFLFCCPSQEENLLFIFANLYTVIPPFGSLDSLRYLYLRVLFLSLILLTVWVIHVHVGLIWLFMMVHFALQRRCSVPSAALDGEKRIKTEFLGRQSRTW